MQHWQENGKPDAALGSLELMLGVGTGPWNFVKQKHSWVRRAQLCHPHSSILQDQGPREPQNSLGRPHPMPAELEEAGQQHPRVLSL